MGTGVPVDVSGLPTAIQDGLSGHDQNHVVIHQALQSYATVATTGSFTDLVNQPQGGSALNAWRAILAKRALGPADILVIGDSIGEGNGASVMGRRAVDVMRDQLRHALQPTGIAGGEGYLPASNLEVSFTSPWAMAGGFAYWEGGLGRRGAAATSMGATLTTTQTCTSFTLYFIDGIPSGGTFTVTVDGGAATAVTLRSDGNYGVSGWNSGALTAGPHTVVVTTTSAGQAAICGAWFFNGDENAGIRLIDSSTYGVTSAVASDWSAAANFQVANYEALPNGAGLVIIELGGNDALNGVAVATYQSNITALIAAIKAVHTAQSWPAPSFLLVCIAIPAGFENTTPPISDFDAAMHAIAAADPTNVAVTSMRDRSYDGFMDAYGLLYTDNEHPNDSGHTWYGDALAAVLRPE